MKKLLPVFAVLLAVGTSAIAQTTGFPEGAEPLTAEALKTALGGKTFKVAPAQGSTWRWQFDANGYFFLNVGSYSNTGKWSTKDGSLCQDTGKSPGCNAVRSKDNVVYLKRDSGEVVALQAQ